MLPPVADESLDRRVTSGAALAVVTDLGVLCLEEERAIAAERKVRFVTPGRDLPHRYLATFGLRRRPGHGEPTRETILESFVHGERVHGSAHPAVHHLRAHVELTSVLLSHVFPNQLPPELREPGPAEPIGRQIGRAHV